MYCSEQETLRLLGHSGLRRTEVVGRGKEAVAIPPLYLRAQLYHYDFSSVFYNGTTASAETTASEPGLKTETNKQAQASAHAFSSSRPGPQINTEIEEGRWWKRRHVKEYLPVMELKTRHSNPQFKAFFQRMHWHQGGSKSPRCQPPPFLSAVPAGAINSTAFTFWPLLNRNTYYFVQKCREHDIYVVAGLVLWLLSACIFSLLSWRGRPNAGAISPARKSQ